MHQEETLICILSDMHSGGDTALFPNHQVQFRHGNHNPTSRQRRIYRHFLHCMAEALARRKGRRLIVVHNGDAVEGWHHNITTNLTYYDDEQAEIHEELMDTFLRGARFGKGDLLYYVNGTEAHTKDIEHGIAKSLGAEGKKAHDFLDLSVNGRHIWFVHHGPQKGEGHTEGNALRSWLARIYWSCRKDGREPPDVVVSGHYHAACYNTFVMDFHTIHGIICPSWQGKTRYAWQKSPVSRNEIGAIYIEILADGTIKQPYANVMDVSGRTEVTA